MEAKKRRKLSSGGVKNMGWKKKCTVPSVGEEIPRWKEQDGEDSNRELWNIVTNAEQKLKAENGTTKYGTKQRNKSLELESGDPSKGRDLNPAFTFFCYGVTKV